MSDEQRTENGRLLRQALDAAERGFLQAPAVPSVLEVDIIALQTGDVLGRATWRPDEKQRWALSLEAGVNVTQQGTGYVRIQVRR